MKTAPLSVKELHLWSICSFECAPFTDCLFQNQNSLAAHHGTKTVRDTNKLWKPECTLQAATMIWCKLIDLQSLANDLL